MKTFKGYLKQVKAYNKKFNWNGEDFEVIKGTPSKEPIKESNEEHLGTSDHHYASYKDQGMITKTAHENLHDHHELTLDEIQSVSGYSGKLHRNLFHHSEEAYSVINDHHRHGISSNEDVTKSIEHHTKHMDSAIDKHATKAPLHVWRGIVGVTGQGGTSHFDNLKPGDTFHDKGFLSTTIQPYTAKSFGTKYPHSFSNGEKKTVHLAHINIPKGSKAMSLNSHGKMLGLDSEHEVLLPRNSKFIYFGKTEHKDPDDIMGPTTIHHLQHIPGE